MCSRRAALADRLYAQMGVRFAGPISIIRNWSFCLFYVMAELWGSVVVSLLCSGVSPTRRAAPRAASPTARHRCCGGERYEKLHASAASLSACLQHVLSSSKSTWCSSRESMRVKRPC